MRRRFLDVAGVVQLVDPTSINEETGEWNGAEFKLTSPSVGVSVAFHPAKGQPDGYGRHFDGKALREPLLPRLAVPFDWSALLPPPGENGAASLELGESFTIRPEVLEPLVAPTGFLPWRGGKRADPQILRAHASGLGGNLRSGRRPLRRPDVHLHDRTGGRPHRLRRRTPPGARRRPGNARRRAAGDARRHLRGAVGAR